MKFQLKQVALVLLCLSLVTYISHQSNAYPINNRSNAQFDGGYPQWGNQTIKDKAISLASKNDDSSPESIRYVKTTRRKAAIFLRSRSMSQSNEQVLFSSYEREFYNY